MSKAQRSGIRVSKGMIPIIIGMINRGDRKHDIAAWFGLNQGRVKDTEDGKYGPPVTSDDLPLPPKGPPGLKGRALREYLPEILTAIRVGDTKKSISMIEEAIRRYDADEV